MKSTLKKPFILNFLVIMGVLINLITTSTILYSKDKVESNNRRTSSQNEAASQKLLLKKSSDSKMLNLLHICDGLYSGGNPDNEEAFQYLSKIGIRTIVSVDGNRPQVELAKKYGLRYIHVPIGYDGIHKKESAAFVHITNKCAPPFYFHCHHGKHRGPASAAIACMAMTGITNQDALQILKQAGTSKDYPGLWRDVENFKLPTAEEPPPRLVEIAQLDSMTTIMARINLRYEVLEQKIFKGKTNHLKKNKRATQEFQSATELSLLLTEDFRETKRNRNFKSDSKFTQLLKRSESRAQDLHNLLISGKLNQSGDLFLSLKKSCNHCHQAYRN